MKLTLLLLYSIHTTYVGTQMTEMQKSLSETSMLSVHEICIPRRRTAQSCH